MATIRQKGAPSLFITLSSAEYQWEGLLKAVYETVNRTPCTDEILKGMTTAEKNRLITDNVVQTTCHFQKRIEKVIRKFMVPGFFEENESTSTVGDRENEGEEAEEMDYQDGDREDGQEESDDAPSYFYRIEFQARGAPHVHLLAWCKDSNSKSYPNLMNTKKEDIPQKLVQIAEYHDKIIKANIDDEVDEALRLNLERFQMHNCTFTCAKKGKTITIQKEEGWGADTTVPADATALVGVPICRFGFAKNPMDETVALLGFSEDEDEEIVKQAKKDYLQIRKYLLRQCYTPKGSKREEQPNYIALQNLDFKTFLEKVGMFQGINEGSEEERLNKARSRYLTSLKSSIKGSIQVFPKRDMRSPGVSILRY